MKWTNMPDDFGWWFFASKACDYDMAKPVRVARCQAGDGPVFYETKLPYETRSERITPSTGRWYGPVKLPRPEA